MSISHIAQFGGRIREEEKIVIIRREDNDKRESAPLVIWGNVLSDDVI